MRWTGRTTVAAAAARNEDIEQQTGLHTDPTTNRTTDRPTNNGCLLVGRSCWLFGRYVGQCVVLFLRFGLQPQQQLFGRSSAVTDRRLIRGRLICFVAWQIEGVICVVDRSIDVVDVYRHCVIGWLAGSLVT